MYVSCIFIMSGHSCQNRYHPICGEYDSVWFMVFNAIFNNISATSWRSVLLVEENVVPGENHRPAASHWQT